MNHINQITRILNTLYDIEYIKVLCTTVENDILIIDFSYRNDTAISDIYNRLAGGHLSLNSNIGVAQLSFTLTEPDNDEEKPQNTTIIAFAYPDED